MRQAPQLSLRLDKSYTSHFLETEGRTLFQRQHDWKQHIKSTSVSVS
jgi:hypothetical protein